MAEHAIQLGLVQITPLLNDPAAKDALREHLIHDHALTPNLKKRKNDYDEWFISKLKETVIDRHINARTKDPDIDAIAKQTAVILELGGTSPAEISTTLEYIEMELRKRSNAKPGFGHPRSLPVPFHNELENEEGDGSPRQG